jgi:hypothetical protein
LTVVRHDGEVLATQLQIGTKHFGAMAQSRETIMDEFAQGDLKWGERTWTQHNLLLLVRPGDPYSIQAFYNEAGAFVGWYVNLQDPLIWSRFGYDTRDHMLDIIVGEDLSSWIWKDEDELERGVGFGLLTKEEATQIRRNGEAVVELIERGEAWWEPWRYTPPDLSLPIASLPDDWDVM